MAKPPTTNPVQMPEGPAVLEGTPPDRRPEDLSHSSPADADIAVLIEDPDQDPGTFAPLAGATSISVRTGLDGDLNRATVEVALDSDHVTSAATIGTRHLSHILEEAGPNALVRIVDLDAGQGDDWPLFEGYIDVANAVRHESDQLVSLEAISLADERMRHAPDSQITGAVMRKDRTADWDPNLPDTRVVPGVPVVFNAGGKPNCSLAWFPQADIQTAYGEAFAPTGPVFTDPDDHQAVHWTAARAVAFLLTFFGPAEVDWLDLLHDLLPLRGVDNVTSDDPFVEAFTARLPELSATSCSLTDALLVVCERVGVHFDKRLSNLDGTWVHWLNFFADRQPASGHNRRMRQPVMQEIAQDPPYTPVGNRSAADVAGDNADTQFSLTLDHRQVNNPILLGDDVRYEFTAVLMPGWRPFPHVILANGYYHYDNTDPDKGPLLSGRLVSVPTIPVLDNVDTNVPAEVQAAKDWWEDSLLDPGLDLDDPLWQAKPETQFHPGHPLHRYVSDVGRLWILGEGYQFTQRDTKDDGTVYGTHSLFDRYGYTDYGAYPWDSPLDLSMLGIPEAAQWVARPRPLGSPFMYNEDGSPIPVVVEVRFQRSGPWMRLDSNRFTVLPEVGGILITEPNPLDIFPTADGPYDKNMIYAIIEQQFEVRVTASIEGDDRLQRATQKTSTVQRQVAQVFDDRSFKVQLRTSSSIFNGVSLRDRFPWLPADVVLDGEPRDDNVPAYTRVSQLATRLARSTVSGNPGKFFLDYDARPGDLVDRISGLSVTFAPGSPILAVEHSFGAGGGRRTRWLLSDDREDGGE